MHRKFQDATNRWLDSKKTYTPDDKKAAAGNLEFIFKSLVRSGKTAPKKMSTEAKDYILQLLATAEIEYVNNRQEKIIETILDYYISCLSDQYRPFSDFHKGDTVIKNFGHREFRDVILPKLQEQLIKNIEGLKENSSPIPYLMPKKLA